MKIPKTFKYKVIGKKGKENTAKIMECLIKNLQ